MQDINQLNANLKPLAEIQGENQQILQIAREALMRLKNVTGFLAEMRTMGLIDGGPYLAMRGFLKLDLLEQAEALDQFKNGKLPLPLI